MGLCCGTPVGRLMPRQLLLRGRDTHPHVRARAAAMPACHQRAYILSGCLLLVWCVVTTWPVILPRAHSGATAVGGTLPRLLVVGYAIKGSRQRDLASAGFLNMVPQVRAAPWGGHMCVYECARVWGGAHC